MPHSDREHERLMALHERVMTLHVRLLERHLEMTETSKSETTRPPRRTLTAIIGDAFFEREVQGGERLVARDLAVELGLNPGSVSALLSQHRRRWREAQVSS